MSQFNLISSHAITQWLLLCPDDEKKSLGPDDTFSHCEQVQSEKGKIFTGKKDPTGNLQLKLFRSIYFSSPIGSKVSSQTSRAV